MNKVDKLWIGNRMNRTLEGLTAVDHEERYMEHTLIWVGSLAVRPYGPLQMLENQQKVLDLTA
jgi:hypothetical protein